MLYVIEMTLFKGFFFVFFLLFPEIKAFMTQTQVSLLWQASLNSLDLLSNHGSLHNMAWVRPRTGTEALLCLQHSD